MNRLFVGLFLSVCTLTGLGQASGDVKVVVLGDDASMTKKFDKKSIKLVKLEEHILDMQYRAWSSGFINAYPQMNEDSTILTFQLGEQFEWRALTLDSTAQTIEEQSRIRSKRLLRKPWSKQIFDAYVEKQLSALENSGYPFASIKLGDVNIEGGFIDAKLILNRGPLCMIDSVKVHGDLKLRRTYLTNYLGIKEGSFYNESRIIQSKKRLSEIPFLSEVKPAEVTFLQNKARIDLFLTKKRASQFDGIVGFLPDEFGKILITGDVKVHLENALKQGEQFEVNWRKLQTRTQELKIEAVGPFVLDSPITLDGRINIYRRDTLFTDVSQQIGVRYVFGSLDYLRLFVGFNTTSLISTSQYQSEVVIPPFLDRKITTYGLELNVDEVDNKFNPSKGIQLNANAAVGNRQIVRNAQIPEIIYDSLEMQSLQAKGKVDFGYFLSPIQRLVWHQRMMVAHILSDQLFNNEATRIGGFKSIRGFNEESIFSTSSLIIRSEVRYQMDKESYVFTFFDGAWYENNSLNSIGAKRDLPYGFGVGLAFGTNSGIFNLAYALGSEQGNPVLLRTAKVHFGFVSVF